MTRDLSALHPQVEGAARTLIIACRLLGIDLCVTGTFRTFQEQDALFFQGRTSNGPIVTHARGGESWHNFRRAFDVAFRVGDNSVTWIGPWELVGEMGEAIGLEWGGRWKGKKQDRPHFEYTGGLTLMQARNRFLTLTGDPR